MSAEMLREAAALMRKDQGIAEELGHIDAREHATWLAVATWLDACALVIRVKPAAAKANALAVAAAYLGRQP